MLGLAFWVPVAGLIDVRARAASAVAFGAMVVTYIPVLRFYKRSPAWAPLLPLAGTLYLLMTISSAVRGWRGIRSRWKGREYPSSGTGTNIL